MKRAIEFLASPVVSLASAFGIFIGNSEWLLINFIYGVKIFFYSAAIDHSLYISEKVRRNSRYTKYFSLPQKKIACYIFMLFIFFISIPSSITAQQKVILHFENRVGEKLLQTDSTYTNAF